MKHKQWVVLFRSEEIGQPKTFEDFAINALGRGLFAAENIWAPDKHEAHQLLERAWGAEIMIDDVLTPDEYCRRRSLGG